MFYRRYLFLQGKIGGMAKLSKEGSGKIKVELTLDSNFWGKPHFCLYMNKGEFGVFFPATGTGKNYTGEIEEKNLTANGVNFEGCGLVVLTNEKGSSEMICCDEGGFSLKKDMEKPPVNIEIKEEKAEDIKNEEIPEKKMLPFGEVFPSDYGLKWEIYSFNELPYVDGAAAHVFLNSGAIECINKYGGFYITQKDDDITIFGIPSRISVEVMPCLNIFRYMSYLKSKTHDFGCYTVGVNIKKNVVFPVIFE